MSGRAGVLALALGLFASACEFAVTVPDAVTISSLSTVSTSVIVEGQILILETSLWRDFQPIVPPGGPPMNVLIEVKAASGAAVPTTVTADALWLVDGVDVWPGVPLEERTRQETAPVLEAMVRNGPKWTVGRLVDVVVQLRDSRGRALRLRAARQRIESTN